MYLLTSWTAHPGNGRKEAAGRCRSAAAICLGRLALRWALPAMCIVGRRRAIPAKIQFAAGDEDWLCRSRSSGRTVLLPRHQGRQFHENGKCNLKRGPCHDSLSLDEGDWFAPACSGEQPLPTLAVDSVERSALTTSALP
jgi:hypothetical protein